VLQCVAGARATENYVATTISSVVRVVVRVAVCVAVCVTVCCNVCCSVYCNRVAEARATKCSGVATISTAVFCSVCCSVIYFVLQEHGQPSAMGWLRAVVQCVALCCRSKGKHVT